MTMLKQRPNNTDSVGGVDSKYTMVAATVHVGVAMNMAVYPCSVDAVIATLWPRLKKPGHISFHLYNFFYIKL